MASNEEICKAELNNEEYLMYEEYSKNINDAMDAARKDEAVAFQMWVRKNWSISKGKYRHRGDFFRNSKLVDESKLYAIFKQQNS